eukprot:scaffold836_cov123-Isochrysis_galbana.AAC.6
MARNVRTDDQTRHKTVPETAHHSESHTRSPTRPGFGPQVGQRFHLANGHADANGGAPHTHPNSHRSKALMRTAVSPSSCAFFFAAACLRCALSSAAPSSASLRRCACALPGFILYTSLAAGPTHCSCSPCGLVDFQFVVDVLTIVRRSQDHDLTVMVYDFPVAAVVTTSPASARSRWRWRLQDAGWRWRWRLQHAALQLLSLTAPSLCTGHTSPSPGKIEDSRRGKGNGRGGGCRPMLDACHEP